MHYTSDHENYQERLIEWEEIEDLVLTYQKQFKEDSTQEEKQASRDASEKILDKFSPLLKKYSTLLKSGQIDWNDVEMKLFVCSFIDDISLQKALKRKKQKAEYRNEIYSKFNFIKETYGEISEEELIIDLQMLLLVIAKRYKQVGKNFCAYVYNVYRYEVTRHIKSFIKNPLNITYKNLKFEDCINGDEDCNIEKSYEDNYYEDITGMPNLSWVLGQSCSEIFSELSVLDRKILIKYYLEEWKDKQIADHFGMHINTVNQRRRAAAKKIASHVNIDINDIKRTRKSGKKALLPIEM